MKKILVLAFILVITVNCNQKSEAVINNSIFNTMQPDSSIVLIVKVYDTADVKRKVRNIESLKAKKEFKISSNYQFDCLDKIFIDAESTGYCCCPTPIYSIHLMNNEEEFGLFYVDTITMKDKIRFYNENFQSSFIIQKQKWKRFLNEIENSEP